jgi:hypothetical protein
MELLFRLTNYEYALSAISRFKLILYRRLESTFSGNKGSLSFALFLAHSRRKQYVQKNTYKNILNKP